MGATSSNRDTRAAPDARLGLARHRVRPGRLPARRPRRPRRRRWPVTGCARSAASCPSSCTSRATTRCPSVERALDGLVAARATTVVLAAATGREGYDDRPVLDDVRLGRPAGQPRPHHRRRARPAGSRHAAPARRHDGRERRGDRAGAGRRRDRPVPRHRAPADRRRRPGRASRGAAPSGSPTSTSRTSGSTGPSAVQAGESTYTEAVRRRHVPPARRGRRRHRRDRGRAGGQRATRAGTSSSRTPSSPARRPARAGPGGRRAGEHRAPARRGRRPERGGGVTDGRSGIRPRGHRPGRRRHLPAADPACGLEDVETFGKFLGGSATNVAVAAARHGRRSRGDHAHRRRPVRPISSTGRCATSASTTVFVTEVDGPPTPVTFCEIFPPDDFPLYFYRYPTAPDL